MDKSIGKLFLHYKRGNHELCRSYITKKLTIYRVFKQGKLINNDSNIKYKYIGSSSNIEKYLIESKNNIDNDYILEHTKKLINVAIKNYTNADFWIYTNEIKRNKDIQIKIELKLNPIITRIKLELE